MVESTNEGAKTASFALGATTAKHSVPTHPDTTGEEDSDVTVEIQQSGTNYTVGMAASATVTVRDNDNPVPPTNVTITEGHHAVLVSWTAPADDGGSAITAYQVEAGGTTATTSSGSVTSHVLDSLAAGTYTIRVRAVHASGNGAWSNSTSATVGPATVTIAGEGDPFAGEGAGSEWGFVEFTVTTDRPVLSASLPLDVSVLASETEDMLPSSLDDAQTASFALNSATHALRWHLATDTTQESDSVVTATIQTSTDYTVGTPSSATVTILDDDGPPERPMTGLTVTEEHYSFLAEWDAYAPGPGEPRDAIYEVQFSDFEIFNRGVSTLYEWVSAEPANFEFRVRATNSTDTDRHGPWSDPVPVRFGGATVTIAGNGPVSEGDDAVFTLTTDRENRRGINGQSVLIVDVLVSETDDVVAFANEKVHTVTFPYGPGAATTVTLTVPTVDDDKDERDSVVTPTIQTPPSTQIRPHTVGSPASATVRVADNDFGNFEKRRRDSCGVSAPHSSGHAIECFQLVGSSHVRTPEGMAERGYEPSRNNPLKVGDIVAMEGVPDDWVISVLGEEVDAAVVTIAAGTSPVTEGAEVMFTLTRATAAATHLSVTVGVAETQNMVFNGVPGSTGIVAWPNRVDILANATDATFLVLTDDDDVPEAESVITATVNAGNGYTAGTSGSASVTVEDNDGGTGQQQAGTPGAPRDFSARPAGESRIDLSWTAPAGEPTGYEIEWSADGETDWTAVDPAHAGTAAEYADEGLDGGTTRYYRVRAFNDAGDGEWSAVASATTNLHLVLEGPDAPENLSASASGASRIDLSWTAPEGAVTGYAVEWSGDGETGWAAVDPEHSGTATEYAHTGLTAHTTYSYRVLALADAVPGEWSDVAGATTDSATRQRGEPPAAPGNVSAGASGQSRIEVSWSAPKGEVTGYEVEWSADGSGSWTAADPAHSGTATGYSDTGLDAGTSRRYRVRAVNGAGSGEWSGPASATTERPELTARFEQAPAEHEGPDSTFTLRLVFSEAVAASYRTLRDEAIRATNGAVRKASRVNGSSAEWEVTVAPSSREAVTVSISGGSDACRQGDAVCTEDGRRLSNSPSVTVEGPPAVPLTAELDGVPEAHDGESTFTFGLTFSEEPRVSYRTLRDSAFDVDGGTVRNARRRQSGSDQSWEITIQPSSHRAVSIRLPETGSCSAGGAICTADGRSLSHALSASVRGPAAMSVSDARVEEAAGAAVAFAVTLSRAASDRVTVNYQTRDGSAQAGEDYRAASGTLTFAAGESSKTIEVAVLDDAHDEGEETFTLALSNATGAWLEDAEATGTIENTDLMPAALLARFGRATAEQVVEHVEERMAGSRERGFRARFAGREFRPGMERDFALGFMSQFAQPMGMGPGGAAPMGAASMGANPMAAHLSGRGTSDGHDRRDRYDRPAAADGRRRGGDAGRAVGRRARRRIFRLHAAGRRPVLQLGVRAEPRAARRRRVDMEPQFPVALRRHGEGAVAQRRRAHDDVRGRLQAGSAHGRPVGGPHAGPGRLRRPERRAGHLVDDRLLPMAGLPGQRPGVGVGRDRLRHRRAEPDAGRHHGARDGDVDGDDGGGHAGRADRLAGHRRVRAGVQGRRAVGRGGHGAGGRRGGPPERFRGRGDAGADGAGGLAGLHRGRPGVADAERRGRAAARRRRRRDRAGHGRRRRPRLLGLSDRAVAGRPGADAGGAPGRRVHRTGHVAVVRLGPHAVEPAGADRAAGPVVGRAGAGRCRGAVEQPDGLRHGLARDVRIRRPCRRGGGLRGAGGRPLRGDTSRGTDDVPVRPGLPGRLQPSDAREREAELRGRGRRATAGKPTGRRREQRRPRKGHHRLVADYATPKPAARAGRNATAPEDHKV